MSDLRSVRLIKNCCFPQNNHSPHLSLFEKFKNYLKVENSPCLTFSFWRLLLVSFIRRACASLVIFSYVNLIMVSSGWSVGQGEAWEEADFRLEVSHVSRLVYPYGDSQKKPGLKVQLWQRDSKTQESVSEASKAFIPFHNPLQQSNIKHFREIVVEEKSKTDSSVTFKTIGVEWENEYLKDLRLFLLWDGSAFLQGKKAGVSSPLKLSLVTSGSVALQDLSLAYGHFASSHVEVDGSTDIPHLKINLHSSTDKAIITKGCRLTSQVIRVLQGHLVHEGNLLSSPHQPLEIVAEGFTLEKEASVQTQRLQLWVDRGALRGKLKSEQGIALHVEHQMDIESTARLQAISLSIKGEGTFTHSIKQEEGGKLDLTSLHFDYFKGTFVNESPLSSTLKIGGNIHRFVNRSLIALHGFFSLHELINDPSGHLKAPSGLHLYGGINRGIMETEAGIAVAHELVNTGTLAFKTIKGAGFLLNQGQLKSKGQMGDPAIINVKTFKNEQREDDPKSGEITGEVLIFNEAAHDWSNKGGKIEVSRLTLIAKHGFVHFDNQGTINSHRLNLVGASLKNNGRVEIDHLKATEGSSLHTSGLLTIRGQVDAYRIKLINEGILHLHGRTYFRKGIVHNKGFWRAFKIQDGSLRQEEQVYKIDRFVNDDYAEFESPLKSRKVENNKDLILHNGVSSTRLKNTGSADIYHSMRLSESFKNTGELSLTNVSIYTFFPYLINKGKLFLKDITADISRFYIQNHKILIMEDFQKAAYAFKGIDNEGETAETYVNAYLYLHILNNKGRVFFNASAFATNLTNEGTLFFLNSSSKKWAIRKGREYEREERNVSLTYLTPDAELNRFGTLAVNDWGQIEVMGDLDFFDDLYVVKRLKFSGLGGLPYTPFPNSDLTSKEINASFKKIEGTLQLLVNNFIIDEDVELESLGLKIWAKDGVKIWKSLKLKELEVFARGAFVGGSSNEALAKIATTEGPLKIEARTVDARFAQLYGKGPVQVKASPLDPHFAYSPPSIREKIFLGDIRTGAVKYTPAVYYTNKYISDPFDSHYDRPDRNDSYIASAHSIEIEAPQGNVFLEYGSLMSQGSIKVSAHPTIGQIEAMTASLQGDEIIFNGKEFRANAHEHMFRYGYSGNSNYPEIHYNLECAEPTLIQAMRDITFNTSTVKLVGECRLLAGEHIYANNRLVAGGAKAYNSEFISEPRHNHKNSRNKGHGWEGWRNFSTKAPIIQAGQQIHIDMGDVQLSGTQNAPQITIKANTAAFINPSRARADQAPVSLSIDLAEYYKEMMNQGGGFIKQLNDQTITTDEPLGGAIIPHSSQLLFFDHVQQHTSIPRFLIDPSPLEFILQHALSQHAGQLNLDGVSGRALMEAMYRNAREFREEKGAISDPIMDIEKFQKAMIAYKAKEIAGQIAYAAQLLVPARLINPLKQIGDTSGTEISIETQGDQLHSGNRVIANQHLHVFAGGKLKRETPKYLERAHHIRKTIEKEVAGPQQVMGSVHGDATITSQGDYTEIAAQSFAGQDLERGSIEGDATISHLELKTTITEQSKKRSGFSHKTTTSMNSSHTHMPSNAEAGRDSRIIGKNITSTGSQDTAHRDLTYEGEKLRVEAGVSVGEKRQSQRTSTAMGSSSSKSVQQSPVFTPAIAQAGRYLFFNADEAILKGVQVRADTVMNNARRGLFIHPKVITLCQSMNSQSSSAFGQARQTREEGEEVGLDSRIGANRIVNAEGTKLHFESIDEGARWMGENMPLIEGIYEESLYKLKKWSHASASASGVFDANVAAVVSLAVGIAFAAATGGVGSPAVTGLIFAEGGTAAAMAGTGLEIIVSQASLSLLRNGGDIGRTGAELIETQSLRNLASSMIAAGALKEINHYFKLPNKSVDLVVNAKKGFIKAAVSTVSSATIGGQDWGQAFRQGATQGVVDTIGNTLTYKIGQAYKGKDPSLDYATHKLAHGALGAVLGAIVADDKAKGSIAGAIGAVASEMIAEAVLDNAQKVFENTVEETAAKGKKISQEEFTSLYNKQVNAQSAANWGKMGAAFVSLLAEQDVKVSIQTATNAVENNLIPMVIGIGFMAWEAYDLYHTYQEEGPEAALKKLGFTIGAAIVGGVVLKRAFKLGGIAVASAEEALLAYKQAHPVFAAFYDKAATIIAKYTSKFKPVIEKYKQLETYADKKIGQGIEKVKEKVGLKIGSPSAKGATPRMGQTEGSHITTTTRTTTSVTKKVTNKNSLINQKHDTKEYKNDSNNHVDTVERYEVGEYRDLVKRSKKDGLEIHHAPQKHPANQIIPSYDYKTAPSIALSKKEHKNIPNVKGTFSGDARQLLAQDVRNLRNYTDTPNSQVQELVNQTKSKYPNSFEKEKM